MKIEKEETELGNYDIHFIKDGNIFSIQFGGNGDLYWYIRSEENN